MLKRSILLILTGIVSLVVSNCSSISPPLRPGEAVIPFESMVEEEWGANDLVKEPKLILVKSEAEVAELKPLILPKHLQLVQQVDFAQYAVLVLLWGVQPSNKHQVVIERITKLDNTLTIRAQFWVPSEEEIKVSVMTSPYQIVKIEQNQFSTEGMQLELQSYAVQK